MLCGAPLYDGHRNSVSLLDRKVGGFSLPVPPCPCCFRESSARPCRACLACHLNHLPRLSRCLKHRMNSVSRWTVVDGFPPGFPLLPYVSPTKTLFRQQPNIAVQSLPDHRRPYRHQHCSRDTVSPAPAGIPASRGERSGRGSGRIPQSSKHGFEMANRMPFPRARSLASSNRLWISRSNIAHTESRVASLSRFDFSDSSIARSTTARGSPPTRIGTTLTDRSPWMRLNTFEILRFGRYSFPWRPRFARPEGVRRVAARCVSRGS